ncbi:short chain dehydrogenase [Ferrimonas sediminicola]|uniref:Short chain dehydrogenase n=1 Tax=Ferrimonas sediminicola TaxID=2569538 RepID=A0A4U1BFP0_9GAMM|nr:short chain dehydrogenase [Ferrimonas sediminicola]TKB49941.1 short chain dehydrogenase [Ferrimonas sediminicola]
MKVLLIGASGTIGKGIAARLEGKHEVVSANHKGGDVSVDLANPESIQAMLAQVGKVDAIISAAGVAAFGPLAEQSDADYALALQNKLMGQVNLVRYGAEYLNDGGSITLTSGVLSRQPFPGTASISMVNGALESFVKAAAMELPKIRLNAVAPVFVKETMEAMGMDSSQGVSALDTAKAYVAALEGQMSGETLDIPDYL